MAAAGTAGWSAHGSGTDIRVLVRRHHQKNGFRVCPERVALYYWLDYVSQLRRQRTEKLHAAVSGAVNTAALGPDIQPHQDIVTYQILDDLAQLAGR